MRINEIFYSIQGEGRNTGRAAVFVRFSGCNLKCPFCDTKHEEHTDMTPEEVFAEIRKYPQADLVIFTGGEPTLQLPEYLVDELHAFDYEVAIETNGTRPVQNNVDFVTVSPKFEFTDHADIYSPNLFADELKVVWTGENDMSKYDHYEARYYYLQPCDTGNAEKNAQIVREVVEYCKAHPKWRISLQTQKILNVR